MTQVAVADYGKKMQQAEPTFVPKKLIYRAQQGRLPEALRQQLPASRLRHSLPRLPAEARSQDRSAQGPRPARPQRRRARRHSSPAWTPWWTTITTPSTSSAQSRRTGPPLQLRVARPRYRQAHGSRFRIRTRRPDLRPLPRSAGHAAASRAASPSRPAHRRRCTPGRYPSPRAYRQSVPAPPVPSTRRHAPIRPTSPTAPRTCQPHPRLR